MNSGLDILTLVYGEQHIELFRRAALKSLSSPRNRKAIYDQNARWNICTDDRFFDYLKRTIDVLFPELELNFISRSDLRDYIDPIQSAVIKQIQWSLKDKKKVLLAPPDTIFSDGTVQSLLDASKEPDSCVVVPHARALPQILTNVDYTNDLVKLTLEHLHKSWTDAEEGHPQNNTFVGGVIWQSTGKTIYGKHYLPSPYLLQFTEEDLQYFKVQISFGSFDHVWPNAILIPRGRQIYLGDSDKAFIVEITDQYKNVPPLWPNPENKPFWRDNLQTAHNSKLEFCWKLK